jgi:hypothetical protein
MHENVVPFHRGDKEFPDWFPKGSYLEAAFAVGRAVPDKAGEVHYDYMIKPITGLHLPCSVILQAGGGVLFNNLDHFGDNARLQSWIAVNKEPLRQLGTGRKTPLTLVGKVISGTFHVYYIIDSGVIYFDHPSIAARIWGHASLLGGNLVIVPVLHHDATLVINRTRGVVTMSRLDTVTPGQHVLGAPVTVETREDAIGSPRLFTSPERMRFFSFTYQGA